MTTTYWAILTKEGFPKIWVKDDGVSPYTMFGSDYYPHGGGGRSGARTETVEEWMVPMTFEGESVVRLDGAPGAYYRRIKPWRGGPDSDPTEEDEWLSAFMGARKLFIEMHEVFGTVEPVPANAGAYGHKIRNLLALGCMEVEAQCKAVLRANAYKGKGGHWNVEDYCKVAKPLRLADREVTLVGYPKFPKFKPFAAWGGAEKLPWYQAYNSVKHDRHEMFHEGTLSHMIHALGAVHVLGVAQFGYKSNIASHGKEFDHFVSTIPLGNVTDCPVPVQLDPNAKWHPVPYPF